MRTIEELRILTRKGEEKNKLRREQERKRIAKKNVETFDSALKKSIEILERAIEEAAANGEYMARTDDLRSLKYRKGSTYTEQEMAKLLGDALKDYLSPFGFKVTEFGSLNYPTCPYKLVISWWKRGE